jgi:hypothetical protein
MTRKWGPAYEWVSRFLDQRDGHKCFICGETQGLIIDHWDNNPHNPDPANLHWLCWADNVRKNFKSVPKQGLPEKEREPNASTRWSSKEGERHDTMRFVWDNLLYHPKTGILATTGSRVSKSKLPSWAIDRIGYGSSKTTAWYQKEDIDNGYLMDTRDEDGTPLVERTDKLFPLSKLGFKE